MAKYIDADVVITSLTELREKYAEVVNHNITYENIVRAGTVEGILSVLREYPAADVAEVNRCKTCFHYKPREYGYNCTVLDWDVNEDDFCSRWEAKDE